MNIYFWGTGKGAKKAIKNYIYDQKITGFIDNDPNNWGMEIEHTKVYGFKEIKEKCDFMIVTVMKYKAVRYQLEQEEFDMDRVLFYFDADSDIEKIGCYFDAKGWRIDILENRINELEKIVEIRFGNIGYEIADKIREEKYWFPVLHSTEEAIERIVNDGCSMIRFGDGEFEIMKGKNRAPFQRYEETLSVRLREVIQTCDENILIGIAANYGDLDIYADVNADAIREYMTEEVRDFHRKMLNPNRVYYDAYMFKCYFPYKDRSGTKERVEKIKRIWNGRDIVLIEGSETRTGWRNDLLDNAKSVKRILCPTKNAFSCYEEILNTAKKLPQNVLILCILGPAGKVMAYDLIHCGYQVVDIGQVDMDYEWYLAGAEEKVPNPYKYVSQLPPAEIEKVEDETYENQIIAKISEVSYEQ